MALLNPVYDIHRLGMFFTASPPTTPRHPAGHRGGSATAWPAPLRATYDGMPDPKVVIAVGHATPSAAACSSEAGYHRRGRATCPG